MAEAIRSGGQAAVFARLPRLGALRDLALAHSRLVLAGSTLTYLALRYLKSGVTLPADLAVYRAAPPALLDGTLYQVLPGQLPFVYPPFAALAFWLLSCVPALLLKPAWALLSIFALWLIVRNSLRLSAVGTTDAGTGRAGLGRTDLWTAAAIWCEPVFSTLGYGQINLFLAAAVLAGVTARRDWLGGLGVGLAAAVKLTPAISIVYFLVTRRWVAAAWSVGFFAGATAISFLRRRAS